MTSQSNALVASKNCCLRTPFNPRLIASSSWFKSPFPKMIIVFLFCFGINFTWEVHTVQCRGRSKNVIKMVACVYPSHRPPFLIFFPIFSLPFSFSEINLGFWYSVKPSSSPFQRNSMHVKGHYSALGALSFSDAPSRKHGRGSSLANTALEQWRGRSSPSS